MATPKYTKLTTRTTWNCNANSSAYPTQCIWRTKSDCEWSRFCSKCRAFVVWLLSLLCHRERRVCFNLATIINGNVLDSSEFAPDDSELWKLIWFSSCNDTGILIVMPNTGHIWLNGFSHETNNVFMLHAFKQWAVCLCVLCCTMYAYEQNVYLFSSRISFASCRSTRTSTFDEHIGFGAWEFLLCNYSTRLCNFCRHWLHGIN